MSLVKALGMEGISKSQVSRLCAEIDERVHAFLARPIEGDWPYVWLDATYVKVRRNHQIVSVAVIVAVGVNTDGRREVLGMTIGHSEAEPFWVEFLRSLARRGLRGVKLVVSDAHEGLKAAITTSSGPRIRNCIIAWEVVTDSATSDQASVGLRACRAIIAAAWRTSKPGKALDFWLIRRSPRRDD